MNLRKTFVTIGITALTFGLAIPAASAHPGKGKRGKAARMAERLDLTPAQTSAIRSMRAVFRVQIAPVRASIKAKRGELRALRQAGAERPVLQAKRAELRDLKASLRGERRQLRRSISELLTPAQQARFAKMRDGRKGKRMWKNGRAGKRMKRFARDGRRGKMARFGKRGFKGHRFGKRGPRGFKAERHGKRGEKMRRFNRMGPKAPQAGAVD